MAEVFEPSKSYPIATLPDDLHDEKPATKMWAIREALFWNDCQGWWLAKIADERRALNFGESVARFWSPLPADPMSREQICAERGWLICPRCDIAIVGSSHNCPAS